MYDLLVLSYYTVSTMNHNQFYFYRLKINVYPFKHLIEKNMTIILFTLLPKEVKTVLEI